VTKLLDYRSVSNPTQGTIAQNSIDGAEMVFIPEGEFIMGSDKSKDSLAYGNELPQREVYLDGYWIYKYEVTVAQYFKFCNETGHKMPPEQPDWGWQDNHPIVFVSWHDAVAYGEWAGVEIPTEAQWEKAARGTDGRIYPWGNGWDASKCNNNRITGKKTTPVGSYPAGGSPYGLMDMVGNVEEWCADWFNKDYYASATNRNPQGPSSGKSRVLRGGSWNSDAQKTLRAAFRGKHYYHCKFPYRGFRCSSLRFPR